LLEYNTCVTEHDKKNKTLVPLSLCCNTLNAACMTAGAPAQSISSLPRNTQQQWAGNFGELGVCDSSDDFDDPNDPDWL
jgi:hypothetical protein